MERGLESVRSLGRRWSKLTVCNSQKFLKYTEIYIIELIVLDLTLILFLLWFPKTLNLVYTLSFT